MESFLGQYGPVLLASALGMAGIYLLLPKVRWSRPLLGAAAGLLALLVGGLFLLHGGAPLTEMILFYAFSGLAFLGGSLMLSQRNPVHAALSFALVVLSTCGLFLLLAAPFLMAATIIVYAGAIIVTFLFVIMLAQQEGLTSADQRSREPLLSSLAGFVLLAALLCVLHKNQDTSAMDDLLAKIKKAADARTAVEIVQVLGDPARQPHGNKSLPLMEEKVKKVFPGFPKEEEVHEYWNRMDVPKLTALFEELYQYGERVRYQKVVLQPPADLKLSPFSGTPANASKGKTELPARNVAGLGRTLFTDYLLPVELAGALLLVASIGAIVIAGRRTEGLR